MIISHTHKFIFIKSFKTAGTSIESTLSNYCSGNDIVTPINDYRHNRNEKGEFIHKAMNAEEFIELGLDNLQHVEALVIKNKVPPEVWNSYFKFSISRNPWDRAVSYFHWEKRQDPAIKPKKRFYHHLGIPFNEIAQIRTLFSDFIKKSTWPSNDNFYTIDNELCVDYVIRYENLSEDFNFVCKKLGLPVDSLPRLKGGMRQAKYHYSDYYDEETKTIVAKHHKNDIRLFDYKFECK
jgi:hypothetical protein